MKLELTLLIVSLIPLAISENNSTFRNHAGGHHLQVRFKKINHNDENVSHRANESIKTKRQYDYVRGYRNYEFLLKDLERIVHIDLKGAPPKPDYFKLFFPFLRENGATGILLEYEDMFPFTGRLAEARHGNAYSFEDIALIKRLAAENGLTIMPLVQTYGHLEWLLKVKSFAHLREDARFPQVITPCLEESYEVIFDMVDQVVNQHLDVPYFHIGCDEVYYKLLHSACSSYPFRFDFTQNFMNHLIKIARHVKRKLPHAKIIFWDDMMHGMNEQVLMNFKEQLVELGIMPMMWGYMEEVPAYFGPQLFTKYGRVFGKIWVATAYKGATSELTRVTSIDHHYKNHVSWINVMMDKLSQNILSFQGVALTGWSRYDHFLALCDMLPQAIPSLVFNLKVMQAGPYGESTKAGLIMGKLGCIGHVPYFGDKDLYSGSSLRCRFPGHEVYEAILKAELALRSYESAKEFFEKYMSPMNLDFAYIHKSRSMEVMQRLNPLYNEMVTAKNEIIRSMDSMYWSDTALEWLHVYFMPQLNRVHSIMGRIQQLSNQNDWLPRPLPYNNNY